MVIIGTQGITIEDGLPLVRQIRAIDRRLPIILVNQTSCEARAIESFRAGVNDYFKSPISYVKLFRCIEHMLKKKSERISLAPPSWIDKTTPMLGESKLMKRIRDFLLRIAGTGSTVLITGETGTGKELAATMIHQNSCRSQRPFICVNCAALPENLMESELFGHKKGAFTGAVADKKGKFELAAGGTLFLDEIGDMSPISQAKILRCIENKKVYPIGSHSAVSTDVRIVAATNKDLEKMVNEGKFRSDLYYRLNVVRVHLPPLRERKEDIPQLIASGIEKLNHQFNNHVEGISDEAMKALFLHQWPGNIRELNNLLESAFINCLSEQIKFVDLPRTFTKKLTFVKNPQVNERDKLLIALVASNWNKTVAAKKLNWSRMKVYRTLKRYSINAAS